MGTKLNGLFLLLTFGAVCGVGAGIFFGICVALYFATIAPPSFKVLIGYILYASVIGPLIGLVPGLIYGLASYYFIKKWHWAVDGGFYGAVGYLVIITATNTPFSGIGILFCILCGFLVGVFNSAFPTWWGRKVHAEGVELIRQKN